MSQNVTLKDIARRTNLSVAAVSKALAGYPQVSKETRERVKAASEELNYQPRARVNRTKAYHRAAEASQNKRVNIILTESWDDRADQWLPALAKAGQRVGLRMELSYADVAYQRTSDATDQHSLAANWDQTIRQLASQADGLLFFGCLDSRHLQVTAQLKVPTVVMGDMNLPRDGHHLPVHWITTDKIAMARLATQTLLNAGHKRIAFFCGSHPNGGWNHQWWTGYRIAMMQAGQPVDPALVHLSDTSDFVEIAANAAARYKTLDILPDAYITPSINVASIFIKHMAAAGVTITPDQLIIGGHVNEARAYGLGNLRLLDEPVEHMTLHAMDLLARLIHGDNLPPAEILVPYNTFNFTSNEN